MLKALIKIRFLSLFNSMFNRSRTGKKASLGKKIGIGILAVYIIFSLFFAVGLTFSLLAPTMIEFGLSWLYFALVGIMTFTLCFIGSIFTTQTQIFDAKDNDLLISMPIKPMNILLSRVLALVILNLMYTAIIMLPAGAVYCYFDITNHYGTVNPFGVIFYILGGILISLLSLAISCVFGWLLALISSRLRRKNLFIIILSVGFLGAYFYFYSHMQTYINELINNKETVAAAIKRAVPPIYNFGMASIGKPVDFLLLLVWCVVPFAIVMFILSRFFINIVTMKKGTAKIKYVKKELQASSVKTALLKKELRHFASLPMYILNCSLGTILVLILGGAVIFKWPEIYNSLLATPTEGLNLTDLLKYFLPVAVCGVLSLCTSMTCTSSASISLEGDRFWIIKSMPLDANDVFYSKLATNLIIGWPPLIITSAICSIVIPMSAFSIIMVFIIPLLVQFVIAVLGLIFNLWLPKFNWINETVVVKQSASVMLSVFGGMIISAAPYILFGILTLVYGFNISASVYLAFTALFYLLLSIGGVSYLATFGKNIYEKL